MTPGRSAKSRDVFRATELEAASRGSFLDEAYRGDPGAAEGSRVASVLAGVSLREFSGVAGDRRRSRPVTRHAGTRLPVTRPGDAPRLQRSSPCLGAGGIEEVPGRRTRGSTVKWRSRFFHDRSLGIVRLRPFQTGGAGHCRVVTSEHPGDSRFWGGGRRCSTPSPSSCRDRRCGARLMEGALPGARRSSRAIARGLSCRPRKGDRPPRSQAREHLPDPRRPREDPRLRPGQAHRRAIRTADAQTAERRDRRRRVMGTVGYMSPEQVRGQP